MNPSPPRTHVLLIGIDAYSGATPLSGCVNDINAVQALLMRRARIPGADVTRLAAPRFGEPQPTDVPTQPPTLANIRSALQRLTTSEVVGSSDRVFIYYSGHGTQLRIRSSSGALFFREALVPFDHVSFGARQYLFDWELNQLLSQIAERTRQVTMVLDCCCSSGATRSLRGAPLRRARFFPTDEVLDVANLPPGLTTTARGVRRGVSSCQVVAACRDDERAHESAMAGLAQGELTRAILAALAPIPDEELLQLRWGKIWRAVVAAVRAASPFQQPWRSGGDARFVFGGPPEDGDAGYAISKVEDRYQLDAGELAGVTDGAEIAVYGATPLVFPVLDSPEDLRARIGVLRVISAERATAQAVAVDAIDPSVVGARGRLSKAGRGARLRVLLESTAQALAPTLSESTLLRVVADRDADVTVVAGPDASWVITDDVFGSTAEDMQNPWLVARSPGDLRTLLEHYHRYSAPLRLARASVELPDALQITLLDCSALASITAEEAQSPDLPEAPHGARFSYDLPTGARLCVRVDNRADTDLSVTLLACQMSGSVLVLGEKKLRAGGMHVFWFQDTLGSPFVTSLAPGVRAGVDRLVAIGSTKLEASLRFLETHRGFRAAPLRSAAAPPPAKPAELWTAATSTLAVRAAPRLDAPSRGPSIA